MGKSVRQPLVATDFFQDNNAEVIPNMFGKSTTKETTRQGNFSAADHPNLKNPTPFDDAVGIQQLDASKQGFGEMAANTGLQFGANVASSFGQGIANTFDLISTARTIKGELTGSKDDFGASLFGLTTRDMQDWANGIAERNPILEKNEGSFSPSDPAWWAKQVASAGTGVGMGIEALGTTALIEYATGGMGTAAALAKLGSLGRKIMQGAKGAEVLADSVAAAKGMRSAATMYGVMSRVSESKMEAMQSYDEIYQDLDKQVDKSGQPKYSKEQKEEIASQGARRTYNGNMLLLPLDILGYRAMVFNPISGAAEGLVERGLAKIGNKIGRKVAGYATEMVTESAEEAAQFVMQNEGKHYAQVLSGANDGSSFLERLGEDVKQDEFWNNAAGGAIGSPVIGGVMRLTHAFSNDNRANRLNELHKDYMQNVGKMDSAIATKIKDYETQGKTKEASVLRRQFAANKALAGLHYDAMSDKDTAFDAHINFISATLGELNAGKTDALGDLGFTNPTPEQVETVKKEFTDYLTDAKEMKSIYDTVKTQYNRNFVPEITQDRFQLNKLIQEQAGADATIAAQKAKLFQYDSLTSQGKRMYDLEYTMQSLREEHSRLTDLYNKTQNKHEKENVQKLLDENQSKITEIVESVNLMNGDSSYTNSQKIADNDIISSSLLNRDYLQAVHDKNRLDNEISLQRKNLSLWNKPEYMAEKTKAIITNAQTTQQTQNAATTTDDAKLKQEAIDKENAIKAKEAAEAQRQSIEAQNQQQGSTIQPGEGNSDLFEDSELINGIKEATAPVLAVNPAGDLVDDEFNQAGKVPEALFSPTAYDFNKSSDDAKDKVKKGVGGLIDKIGTGNISFEDLVRHVVKVQGTTVADNIFNALKYGWEANGHTVEDYDAVYEKVFGNPMDDLMAGVSQLIIQDAKELEQKNTQILEDNVAQQGQPEGFDNNNQPVYTYKGVITNEASPKMAFNTRLTHLVQTENEDGTIDVKYEYSEQELNTGDYIDSLPLLDPDSFNEGTELEIKVPINFNDIKIPVYAADGSKLPSVSFGQYVAEKGLTSDMQEYRDKLPMVIYKKGSTGKGVAFVHDIGWYHPLRFNQEFKDDMANAIAQTRAIRNEVLTSPKQTTTATITGKRQTTFAGLKTGDGTTVSLKQANPQTQLTVALSDDTLNTSKNRVYPNENAVLINTKFQFRTGQILEVRRFGTKDGKETHVALPVLRQKLDEASRLSVLQAINIYANRSNKSEATRAQHDKVAKHISDTMGLDILNPQGLEKYLKHFINIFNTEKAHSNADVEAQAKAKLAAGTPYIAFIAGGNIVFGRAGEAAYVNNATGKPVGSFFINPASSVNPTTALTNLAKPNIIGWYEQNLDLNNLNQNKPVVTIARDFVTTVSAPNYNDYLLERLHTNVRSYNIGTEDKPNYVTNIQPVITYDTNNRLQRVSQPETNTEVGEQVVEKTSTNERQDDRSTEQTTQTEEPKADPAELARLAMERAKAKLGADFKKGKKLFSPTVLTDEQRDQVAADINRIAGLTPSQQFDITDFMYNQITAMVNLETKQVTKADIDKEVERAFKEVLAPLKAEYEGEIKINQDLLTQFPQLAESGIPDVIESYEYRVAKIKAIEDNFHVLKQEAYNRVAKYTGITENSVRFEKDDTSSENPDTNDGAEGRSDFWTDVLTESPENKLTYTMRRFFGQIKAVDKAGETIPGFLGLPTYVGADTIIRTLMVNLADVPSNLEAMLAKLEEIKAGLPWMQEVIDKLKTSNQQKKQQFVTVMSNTSLRMKFTMISFNRKMGTWTTKVWDTNINGVANAVRDAWKSNFIDSNLVLTDEEGNYTLNDIKANVLIDKFRAWKGLNLKKVESNLDIWKDAIAGIKKDTTITVTPTGTIAQELRTNLVKATDRMVFTMKGYNYQISNVGNGKFKIEFQKQSVATEEEAADWLKDFGIVLSPETLKELHTKGMFHNYKQRKWTDLFETGNNSNGLFGILYNKLETLVNKGGALFNEEGGNPLDDTVITSLANLEAKYNNTVTPFGFRDNGKSFFALTAPKFITDRARDLRIKDGAVVNQLRQISFSQNSLWLKLLSSDKFRDKFNVSHIGANAFKELGKKGYKDNSITSLADADHELTKLGMFWDTTQGEVAYEGVNASGQEATLNTYPGTNIEMRMATMFSPTMSDKSMMTLITTAVLNLQNKDLQNGDGLSDEALKVVYEQTIKPELARMVKFWQNGGKTNISAYDKGAAMFLLMPEMNNIELVDRLKLVDAIRNEPNTFNIQALEANKDVMDSIHDVIQKYVATLVEEKLTVWERNGLIKSNGKEGSEWEVAELKFIDKKYGDKFRGTDSEKAKMMAMDFVVNSMIANANSFMTMAGDPALYYKEGKRKDSNGNIIPNTPIQKAQDTFINVGKRLANQIAPGTSLANSEYEKYIQVFLNDRKSLPESNFLKFVTKINDGTEITDAEIDKLQNGTKEEKAAIVNKYPKGTGFIDIEGADAQEYTTWQEHLSILNKLGKTADELMDITAEDIMEARALFASGIKKDQLTHKQQKLIGKVMQPIKPVYTGQIYDKNQDVMRTVYIKSSSFPLIPQLTAGFEIDKLRVALEKLEKSKGMPVRASYQSANKVGSINTPANIWDKDGNISDDALTNIEGSSLILDRKNFRIQQEVPFKSGKKLEDTITLGTQLMKGLFGDEIMKYDGFILNGKVLTGKELHSRYNSTFINLVSEKRNQLFNELGLDELGNPIDAKESMAKMQKILKDEAVNRGYPLQDIQGLKMTEDGQFNLPLWSSSNSNRYESMLNAIVSNRLIKMKFPGNSYVVGSEEGFRRNPNVIQPSDRIIFGHPGIGKSFIKNSNNSILDFDEDYKTQINTKFGLAPGFKARNTWRESNKALWDTTIRELWAEAKRDAKATGKRLMASDMLLLREFENDFDKVITMPEKTFVERAKQRNDYTAGETESWKGNLDKVISKVDQSKVINTEKYLSELLNNGTKEEGELSQEDKSSIIYTSIWNGKSLQATYHTNGELKKAQVFVASKFRDRDGQLVDLMKKENGTYKYLEVQNGSFILKEEMFDKDLLSLLTFRIPTSGHQSGSQVEIAGFLPHISADLMIVPRNFTKQKGLDFDVDKENSYQLWHYMTNDGKFEALSEKHRTEILANADKLKDSNNEAANNFFDSIFGDDVPYTPEEIKSDKFLNKLNSKINEKLMHNELIKINHSVFGNPNEEIQAKINKTLNTDFGEEQASLIEGFTNANKDEQYWTPLSDEYQKGKMGLGASGKIGTGAYSLDVVFHSLAQQAAMNGSPLSLRTPDTDTTEEEGERGNLVGWRFGTIQTDGMLGRARTIDGDRTISEVMAERQNIAVDNEKLQVMGRVNLNDLTMDVDKVFNMLGIDKGEDGNSIPFLFLSQPIIKDYVAEIKNASSNMAEFQLNKEQAIIERLIKKYDPNNELKDMDLSEEMTNANFIDGIKTKGKDGKLQVAVLNRFMEMKTYGIALRGIQSTINTDSKGLGKSFFDVIEKRNALNRLGIEGGLVQGARGLIGHYQLKEDLGDRVEDLLQQGYIDIGNYVVKPTTLSGAFNIMGVTTAYNLWSKFFPYDAAVTSQVFNEIIPIISNGEVGDAKKIELKQEIFRGMKKYFSAFKKNGIIQTTDDINAERKRIFIDSEENTSLAKYIKALMQTTGDEVVDEFIKKNKLLNRFEFDIQKDGQPSKIKFNNAAGEEFDEQYLYESLASLMEVRGPEGRIELPEIGNKKYTLDTLAQDLIAYCYLGNATQEAIQFTKYVPVSYLDTVGYSRVMRVAGEQLDSNPALLGLNPTRNDKEKHLVSEFAMQYIQHNPETVKVKYREKDVATLTMDRSYSEGTDLSNLQSFKIKDKDITPTFVSIYNPAIPKGEKKFQLYWFDGVQYNRVPVLGTFGMDEYQPRSGVGQSLINGRVRVKAEPQAVINSEPNKLDSFNIASGSVHQVMDNIIKARIPGYSELAEKLKSYVSSGTTIKLSDEYEGDTGFDGLYVTSKDMIIISPAFMARANTTDVGKTVLHELIHALTVKQIQPYIREANNNVQVTDDAPTYVTNLVRIYSDLRGRIGDAVLNDVLDRIVKRKGITQEERHNKYGLTNIYEFIAMAMTEKEFQQYLSKNEFKQSGKTLLQKFKDAINSMLTALGVKFEADSAAAQAINSIFEFIEENSKIKSLDELNAELTWDEYEAPPDYDSDELGGFDDEEYSGPPEASFTPTEFPIKKLDIKNEKCL